MDIKLFKEQLNTYIANNYKEETIVHFNRAPVMGIKRKKPRNKPVLYSECAMAPFDNLKPSFQELLFSLIDKSGLKDSDVYNKANIDRRLFSKIRSDSDYSPSKNTVIQLAFGLMLEIDKALDLLSSAGYTLSFSKKSDVIVRFYLENKNYDLIELNNTLYEYDLKPLF